MTLTLCLLCTLVCVCVISSLHWQNTHPTKNTVKLVEGSTYNMTQQQLLCVGSRENAHSMCSMIGNAVASVLNH